MEKDERDFDVKYYAEKALKVFKNWKSKDFEWGFLFIVMLILILKCKINSICKYTVNLIYLTVSVFIHSMSYIHSNSNSFYVY